MSKIPTGTILEASDLSVVLGGHRVLDIQAFQVQRDEVLVIIGPNGSGKTTLLLTLAMLHRPAAGVIFFRGQPVDDNTLFATRRKFAVVFQEPLLLNTTVWDNVALGLRLHGIGKEEIRLRASKWLERFGISKLAQRQGKTLSGGEGKRVSLARAFALQPEVLFLDEPFNGLDSPTRQSLMEDFESVLHDNKVTTVMVTHERNEALLMADRVVVLINGRIRQAGTPQDVFSSPIDEEVAGFVEAGNVMRGNVLTQSGGVAFIDINGRQIQAVSSIPAGSAATVYIHYEDITINIPSSEPISSSARNQLKGKIVKVFPAGSQLKVVIDCGFMLASLITRRSWDEMGLAVGKEVVASFKASCVHAIPRL